jgi:hypothetical protein
MFLKKTIQSTALGNNITKESRKRFELHGIQSTSAPSVAIEEHIFDKYMHTNTACAKFY